MINDMIIYYLLGVASGVGIMLFNIIFLICYWHKEDNKENED